MSRTWIFQGNPDDFDIMGYLHAGHDRITWLVRRYGDQMQKGDRVYLWQAIGSHNATSGIVAEATIDSLPWSGPDHAESLPFWVNPDEASMIEMRVWLKVKKVANSKEVVQRKWLLEDPICRDLLILRQPAGTNFPVEGPHEDRLLALWTRTGIDWDRAECVAAMLVYEDTRGQPLSKLPGTRISKLALLTSRAVGGAYNKVLNFRALDPRDERAGLSGGSDEDEKVWNEFFDNATQEVRYGPLMTEFDRLWKDSTPSKPTAGEVVVGTDYQQADENVVPSPAQPGVPDPDTVGRGLNAHARTQNGLASFLKSRGFEPTACWRPPSSASACRRIRSKPSCGSPGPSRTSTGATNCESFTSARPSNTGCWTGRRSSSSPPRCSSRPPRVDQESGLTKPSSEYAMDTTDTTKALDEMTTSELRQRFEQVFGEATGSKDKQGLVTRPSSRGAGVEASSRGACPTSTCGRWTGPRKPMISTRPRPTAPRRTPRPRACSTCWTPRRWAGRMARTTKRTSVGSSPTCRRPRNMGGQPSTKWRTSSLQPRFAGWLWPSLWSRYSLPRAKAAGNGSRRWRRSWAWRPGICAITSRQARASRRPADWQSSCQSLSSSSSPTANGDS